jgi:hypothetical protein
VEGSVDFVGSVGTGPVVLTLRFFSIPPVIDVHWTARIVEGGGLAMVKSCRDFDSLGVCERDYDEYL